MGRLTDEQIDRIYHGGDIMDPQFYLEGGNLEQDVKTVCDKVAAAQLAADQRELEQAKEQVRLIGQTLDKAIQQARQDTAREILVDTGLDAALRRLEARGIIGLSGVSETLDALKARYLSSGKAQEPTEQKDIR